MLFFWAGQQARAVFNAKAIKGYIQFSTVSDIAVRIQTNLTGLTGKFNSWNITSLFTMSLFIFVTCRVLISFKFSHLICIWMCSNRTISYMQVDRDGMCTCTQWTRLWIPTFSATLTLLVLTMTLSIATTARGITQHAA